MPPKANIKTNPSTLEFDDDNPIGEIVVSNTGTKKLSVSSMSVTATAVANNGYVSAFTLSPTTVPSLYQDEEATVTVIANLGQLPTEPAKFKLNIYSNATNVRNPKKVTLKKWETSYRPGGDLDWDTENDSISVLPEPFPGLKAGFVATVSKIKFGDKAVGRPSVQLIARELRARAGDAARIEKIFAQDAYARFDPEGTGQDAWARAVATILTGFPLRDPAALEAGGRPAVTRALFGEGRCPPAATGEDAVNAALYLGGWDGGEGGGIGEGRVGLERCERFGSVLARAADLRERSLAEWPAGLWDRIGPGAVVFWSSDSGKIGRVAMVLRKVSGRGAGERGLQLWGAVPVSFAANAQKSFQPMLQETGFWMNVPDIKRKLDAAGRRTETLGLIGIGTLVEPRLRPSGLRTRGRCRLVLRQRGSGGKLVYRSSWLSMEEHGLSIVGLLCSLRTSPRYEEIEAAWYVDSPRGASLVDAKSTGTGKVSVGVHRGADGDRARPNDVAGDPMIAGRGQPEF